MQITIKSKPFSISSKKYIFVDGKELYTAKSEAFATENHFKLIHLKTGFVKSILTREIFLFRDKFNIRLLNEDNIQLNFKRISIWRPEYVGYYFDDKYEILHPAFEKYSILKNGVLVANFKKTETFYEEINNFELLSLGNKDLELIITFCLFIHIKESEKDK